jgi:pyruvyltransferase
VIIRKLESVNLKFYQEYPNVGDAFSLDVAKHYFSANVVPCSERALAVPNLMLVGSLLRYADAFSHICGAGFISTEPRHMLQAVPKSVNCVRGPLTQRLLEKQGVVCPPVYADPGILAPVIYPQTLSSSNMIGVIPHYVDAGSPWIKGCQQKGLKIINVFSPLETFFADINQCQIILSSSLHGIIFAHAYGKPALWIELSDKITGKGFKFYDYYLSVGVKPEQIGRVRITEKTDPYEIAKLATLQSHAGLYESLAEAIDKTIRQLAHSQEPKGVLK